MSNTINITNIEDQIDGWDTVLNTQGANVRKGYLFTSLCWSAAGQIQSRLHNIMWLNKAAGDARGEKMKEEFLERIKSAEIALLQSEELFDWSYRQADPMLRPTVDDILARFKPAVEQYNNKIKLLVQGAGLSPEEAERMVGIDVDQQIERFDGVKEKLKTTLERYIKAAQASFLKDLMDEVPHEPEINSEFDIPLTDAVALMSKLADKADFYSKRELQTSLRRTDGDLMHACGNYRLLQKLSHQHKLLAHRWNMEIEAAPNSDEMMVQAGIGSGASPKPEHTVKMKGGSSGTPVVAK